MSALPRPVEAGATRALISCIERIEELLEQESAALSRREEVDFQDLNHRKSRALLELTRIARSVSASASREAWVPLERLREKLRRNAELLETHIGAVRELAGLLASEIAHADSDGTYSMRGGALGR